MSEPFQPGDVVVCVDDADTDLVKRGSLYRVDRWRGPFVVLVGVFGWSGPDGQPGMRPHRFRKIDDEVTEEFREVLRKLPVKTLEPAA